METIWFPNADVMYGVSAVVAVVLIPDGKNWLTTCCMAALATSLATLSTTLRAILRVFDELLGADCSNDGIGGIGGAEGVIGAKTSVSPSGVWYSLLPVVRTVGGVWYDDWLFLVIGLCMVDVLDESDCVDGDDGTGI